MAILADQVISFNWNTGLAYLRDGGFLGLALLIIYGSYKDVWDWSRNRKLVELDRDRERTEKEMWRAMALSAGKSVEKVSEATVSVATKRTARRQTDG